MKISVLGAGNIGKFIAEELAKNAMYDVTVYDNNPDVGKLAVVSRLADLSKEESIKLAIKDAAIVVNALPSFLGYNALKIAIEMGKHVVDISFMSQDPRDLKKLAVDNKVSAVVDFGFAPGLCNVFVGRAKSLLTSIKRSIIYVGGLPQHEWDEYKTVFSARDVLEIYSRPARVLKRGVRNIDIPFAEKYGLSVKLPDGNDKFLTTYLSGFISDGLRTMSDMNIPTMFEVTLRYEKHFEKMKHLMEDGFFKPENIEQTAKVLAEKWKRGPSDRDMSILKVVSDNGEKTVDHFLYDKYDETNGVHSMARVTGYPVIFMVDAIASGRFKQTGIILPEVLGEKEGQLFDNLCKYLVSNGITVTETIHEAVVSESK